MVQLYCLLRFAVCAFEAWHRLEDAASKWRAAAVLSLIHLSIPAFSASKPIYGLHASMPFSSFVRFRNGRAGR
jgi:hypothetical protein